MHLIRNYTTYYTPPVTNLILINLKHLHCYKYFIGLWLYEHVQLGSSKIKLHTWFGLLVLAVICQVSYSIANKQSCNNNNHWLKEKQSNSYSCRVEPNWFLVAQQLNTYFCVCVLCLLCVCPRFLIWNISLFEYLEWSRIFRERERFHIKNWEQTDNKLTQTVNPIPYGGADLPPIP